MVNIACDVYNHSITKKLYILDRAGYFQVTVVQIYFDTRSVKKRTTLHYFRRLLKYFLDFSDFQQCAGHWIWMDCSFGSLSCQLHGHWIPWQVNPSHFSFAKSIHFLNDLHFFPFQIPVSFSDWKIHIWISWRSCCSVYC